MDAALQDAITRQVDRLCNELAKRQAEHERIMPYFKRAPGRFVIPPSVVQAKLTKSYTAIMGMSDVMWGKLVVASKLDRLEVNGITSPDDAVSEAVWEQVWQENELNLESKLAHRAALLDGRSHASVWPAQQWLLDGDGGTAPSDGPTVTFDDCTTMIVEYAEGSRQRRAAALRRWEDDSGQEFVNLYRPDGIFKFAAVKDGVRTSDSFTAGARRWVPREVLGEEWPLPNPLGVVPVVELGVNRELASGRFTVCRGEFADETGLLDRVNLLTFLGMVLAVSMSFPLRILFGDEIAFKKDSDGNAVLDDNGNPIPIPPFNAYVGGVAHLEDSDARIDEFKAADRKLLSVYGELAQFATATTTPRHYFPSEGVIANVAAETIRAFEGPMHAAVNGSHKPSLAAGHEEILRLGGLMLPSPVKLSRRASLSWANHESRSLAEQASAFAQLTGQNGLPWVVAAEIALGSSQDDLRRYADAQADSAFAQVIAATAAPVAAPKPPALPVAA